MNIADAISRHDKIVLQFSGGKDSLACLYLLEPYWQKVHVAWVNTGDAFPETLAQMGAIREMVPHFHEVPSDVKAQQAVFGLPCDVLPVRSHFSVIAGFYPHEKQRMQSCFACCRDNLWLPMARFVGEMGATLVIRGQRLDEVQRTPVKSGDVIGGVEFLFPLQDWTSDQVRQYLGARLPEHYAYMDTGLDCMHCTGHLFENLGKRRYVAERHPEVHAEVSRRLDVIAEEVAHEMAILEAARRVPEMEVH